MGVSGTTTRARSRRWTRSRGAGSCPGWSAPARCWRRSAIPRWACAVRSSPAPTARDRCARPLTRSAGPPGIGRCCSPARICTRTCERIVRDGEPITEAEFAALVGAVDEAARRRCPRSCSPPGSRCSPRRGSWPRVEADAEVLVCEVGLGGRLDSTNVLDLGVAAVTNVALDHQDLLGETIPEIAREKAAIIKPGNRAVTAAVRDRRSALVRARVGEVGATLTVVGGDVPFAGRSAGMRGVAVETVFDGRAHLGARAVARRFPGRPTSRPPWRSATPSGRAGIGIDADAVRARVRERPLAPAAWTGSTASRHCSSTALTTRRGWRRWWRRRAS